VEVAPRGSQDQDLLHACYSYKNEKTPPLRNFANSIVKK
jgi:hypothetical protein